MQACWAQHKRQYPNEMIHKEIEEFNKQCSVWWYNLSEQEREHGEDKGKYLRYMKVQTLADGSKVRTILDPDDPILDEYEIKKRDLAGKLENNMTVTFNAPKSRMDQIHREERKRISPPRESSVRDRIGVKSSSASKMSMDREKQKSVKSRLSITTSSTSSVSKHDPRARKRITGPPEEDDLRSRLGSSRRSY